MHKPLVSVWMITYNHENYIREAIDSILMQEVDFDYEIVIGEDCSTDGTREILLEYAEQYPEKFKLLLHDKNIGIVDNMLTTFKACSGKYVAMLEGDDAWGDTTKLQKQVDFLEENPKYVVAYHNIELVTPDGEHIREGGYSRDYDSDTMKVGRAEMQTSCCVYRNFDLEFPLYFKDAYLFDPFLVHLAGFHGEAKFLDTIKPSKYRIHNNGLWSGIEAIKRLKISIMTKRRLQMNLTEVRLKQKLDDVVINQYLEVLFVYLRDGYYKEYRALWKAIGEDESVNVSKMVPLHTMDATKRALGRFYKRLVGQHNTHKLSERN